MFSAYKVVIKGGGDLASAAAHKLQRSGFPVIITEIEQPRWYGALYPLAIPYMKTYGRWKA